MKNKIFFIFIVLNLTSLHAKPVPGSFADLAEKLMPSVVNISTTQTIVTNINPFPFEFPPGSPFEDMFKEFNRQTERKATALGSGFIIDRKGIVVTNNHVIQGAEDIVVSVNGSTEYKAKVIGTDPYMDLAVLQIESDKKFKDLANTQSKILLQIHDELIFEVPNVELKKISSIIKEEMTSVVNSNLHSFSIPLTVDINSGNNWGMLH